MKVRAVGPAGSPGGETLPIGGPVGMIVLVALGATLTVVLARRAVRRAVRRDRE